MWLITPVGFFSIVRRPDDVPDDTLTIRSRVESDLEALWEKYLPNLSEIAENAGTDYRFRAKAPRSEVAKALAKMVHDLNYDNFKEEVGRRQGKDRARAYEKVWSVLLGSSAPRKIARPLRDCVSPFLPSLSRSPIHGASAVTPFFGAP
jgi:hypothetical protein